MIILPIWYEFISHFTVNIFTHNFVCRASSTVSGDGIGNQCIEEKFYLFIWVCSWKGKYFSGFLLETQNDVFINACQNFKTWVMVIIHFKSSSHYISHLDQYRKSHSLGYKLTYDRKDFQRLPSITCS